MENKKLEDLRAQINRLDNQMIELLDQRSLIVTEVGKLKDKNRSVVDETREQEVLDRLISLSKIVLLGYGENYLKHLQSYKLKKHLLYLQNDLLKKLKFIKGESQQLMERLISLSYHLMKIH